ncbi:MAG: alpha-E domain-containing protein, partial [Synechococcaceae bacterium WBB_32_011]|nr:alpha-E domain-containing protein [Synechococcaceae bacterium WBB_32_011]
SLGRLQAKWNYSQVGDVIDQGLHQVIDQLQQQINELHTLLEIRYFTSNQCT